MKVISVGSVCSDVVVALRKMPIPGDMNYVSKEEHATINRSIGGHAAILAVDLVKLGIDSTEIGVIGAIGNDEKGDFLQSSLKKYGITTYFQRIDNEDTAENIILAVKNEEKRYDLFPGANLYLAQEYVKKVLDKNKPKFHYSCAGYSGTDLYLESIFKKLKEVRKDGFILLDVVDPYKKPKNFIFPALKYVDAFKSNEIEAMQITGTKTIQGAKEKLFNEGLKTILITKGPKGLEFITKEITLSQSPFKVESIDQTGCGDAFCAGIIYKMIQKNKCLDEMNQEELKETLTYGQAVGAIASTAPGATTAVLKRNVEKLLDEQNVKLSINKT